MSKALDYFGRFVIEKLRDKAFDSAELTMTGHAKAPGLRRLQADVERLTDEQRDVARRLVRQVIDGAIHDFSSLSRKPTTPTARFRSSFMAKTSRRIVMGCMESRWASEVGKRSSVDTVEPRLGEDWLGWHRSD
jgi:hypothetical protein